MSSLEIFCVTDKIIPNIEKTGYNIATPKNGSFPKNYLKSDVGENIIHKEKYYSELTFHYWYWKNRLNITQKNWIGFCQKRRFWIKSEEDKKIINTNNLNQYLLDKIDPTLNDYESIICNPINVSGAKKIKMIKRGWRNLIKDPSILFNNQKETIAFHFDMHHGHNNLKKAANLLEKKDKNDFVYYINNYNFYNPHIMCIARPEILEKWFNSLFPWLEKCEEVFGFDNLKGYDTLRLYAYFAERYLSYWFKKYTKYKEQPWVSLNL